MSRKTATIVRGVAVIALVAAVASACGSSGKSSNAGSQAAKKNLELIVGTKKEAAKRGAKLTINGPADFTSDEQKPLIDAAVSTKPDALLIAPTDTSALDPDLQQVQGNGTKIVFVDTSSSNPALGITRITSNNAQGGALAADELAKQIGDKGT